jgi:hypothetical protein
VSNVGSFVTYRAVYDRLRYEGFIAGSGNDGFRANVRSAIKRIRNKFRAWQHLQLARRLPCRPQSALSRKRPFRPLDTDILSIIDVVG